MLENLAWSLLKRWCGGELSYGEERNPPCFGFGFGVPVFQPGSPSNPARGLYLVLGTSQMTPVGLSLHLKEVSGAEIRMLRSGLSILSYAGVDLCVSANEGNKQCTPVCSENINIMFGSGVHKYCRVL